MKIVRPSTRTRRDDHLIPLINVIFLMLIFFMVVGRVTPREPLAVEPPVSAQEARGETGEHVILLDANGRLAIGDDMLALEALPARIAAWRTAARDDTAPSITIKADAAVTAGRLRETLNLLTAAGITRVELMTRTLPKP